MATIFAVPGSTHLQTIRDDRENYRRGKRKRKTPEVVSPHGREENDTRDEDSLTDEYSAVVSPEERSQRRLAGQTLSLDPPSHPFPHSKPSSKIQTGPDYEQNERGRPGSGSHSSLHLQHLSCLTAILHQSIIKRDYKRAARALGLILREEVFGHTIDIRAVGHWGIAAETLLHLPLQVLIAPDDSSVQSHSAPIQSDDSQRPGLLRQGFEAAKKYYEAMIIQYPNHKTWPESVNVIDFYLAMFSIWIYIVNEESKYGIVESYTADQGITNENHPTIQRQQVRLRKLSEANQIARRMDQCMTSIPMMDNPDLVNLRAMVAQWQIDLNTEFEQRAEKPDVDVQMYDGEEEAIAVSSDNSQSEPQTGESLSTLDYLQQGREFRETAIHLTEEDDAGSPD